jgi:hypothetical protein
MQFRRWYGLTQQVPGKGKCAAGVRGRSSVVERQLPKLYVVGSIPIARSKSANDHNRLFALPLNSRSPRSPGRSLWFVHAPFRRRPVHLAQLRNSA